MGSGQYPLSPLAAWLSFSRPHSLWPSFPWLLSFLRPHFISFLYLPSFLAGGVIAFVVVWPCSVRRLIVKEIKAYQRAQEATPPDLAVVVAVVVAAAVAVMIVGGVVIGGVVVVVVASAEERLTRFQIENNQQTPSHVIWFCIYIT